MEPERLEELVVALRAADRAIARAVTLAGRLAGSGVCETVEGLPLEHFLALAARLTHADRGMLITAGEVLQRMRVTAGLFADGSLSWAQVRGIVSAAKGLRVAQRQALDVRVAATIDDRGGLEGFEADALVWAVSEAPDELRGPRAVEQTEQRQRDTAFLSRQMSFDGWMRVYGEFDPLLSATLNNALDAAAGRPPAGSGPPDAGPGDDDDPRWTGTSKARQDAAALGSVCGDWLGGDTNRPARPLFVAVVDTNQTSVTPSGMATRPSVNLGPRRTARPANRRPTLPF